MTGLVLMLLVGLIIGLYLPPPRWVHRLIVRAVVALVVPPQLKAWLKEHPDQFEELVTDLFENQVKK